MGISGRTREAKRDLSVSDAVPAAIAVLGEGGAVERATRDLIDRFELRDGTLASCAEEADEVIAGRADRLTALIDGLEASLVAVLDRDGRRMAVVTIPAEDGATDVSAVSPVLEEPLDESPAIVWLKDLEGRYLRVNRRYVDQLSTDADSVCGKTDAELTAALSIEGMRLEEEDTAAGRQLLELEYRIGAFEERPALTVLRFALRDGEGTPTATCSVAAPVAEEAVARAECERLMRVDRWGRLDAFAISSELLDDWGLTPADASFGPPLDHDDVVAAAVAERDEALDTAARLEEELSQEREQRGSLQAERDRVDARADELAGAVAAEQARYEELQHSLVSAEARVLELEGELTGARGEIEEQQLRAEALEAAADAPEGGDGLRWQTSSQRSLSAALVGIMDWRTVLEHAVGTLGAEGGWDATIAWCPDRPRGPMACAAIWARDPDGLATFSSRTWKDRADASTAEFGRARNRMAATCLLDLQSAEEPLLRVAAAEGMSSALLIPVSDGTGTVAMLELLSRKGAAPSAELMVSLDAIALQLGALAKLLKLSDVPPVRM